MKSVTLWPVLVSQILIFYTVKGMVMEKKWEVTYLDDGKHITEYHLGVTKMEARCGVTHRLKRQVKFIEVVVVEEEEA